MRITCSLLIALAVIAGPRVAAACVDPAAFGAIPDDLIDDAPAINAALAAAKCVELQCGIYNLEQPVGGPSSIVVPDRAILRGQGPCSRLVMTGTGRNREWRGVDFQGRWSRLVDLEVSGELAHTTEEQTHCVQITGPAADNRLVDVSITHPPRPRPTGGYWPGGACVRLIGASNPARPVERTLIERATFTACDRSAVEIQRQTFTTTISRSTVTGVGDQAVDVEATGSDGDVGGVRIIGLDVTGGVQGNNDIAIQCVTGICRDVSISESNLTRGIYLRNVEGVTVTGNFIRHTTAIADGTGTIDISKRAWKVQVDDNEITRAGGSGPLVRIVADGAGIPSQVTVDGNVLDQLTNGPVLYLRGVQGTSATGNRTSRSLAGVFVAGEIFTPPAADIVIDRNVRRGPFNCDGRPPPCADGFYAGPQVVYDAIDPGINKLVP